MRIVCLILSFGLPGLAQVDPEYVIPKENPHTSPTDLNNGQQLFMAQCARCHGPKGEGGRGAVLAQPRLHAPDDQSLFVVIRDGIKGTEMPGGYALDTLETWQLTAYVRSLGRMPRENLPGDPMRGQDLYQTKGRCAQCHIIGGQGGSLGPELTEIGARRSAAHLRTAILRIRNRRSPKNSCKCGWLQRTAAPSAVCGSTKTRSRFRYAI